MSSFNPLEPEDLKQLLSDSTDVRTDRASSESGFIYPGWYTGPAIAEEFDSLQRSFDFTVQNISSGVHNSGKGVYAVFMSYSNPLTGVSGKIAIRGFLEQEYLEEYSSIFPDGLEPFD